jgi:hypothetical protein
LRLAFLQVRHGKLELVAGQTWSFLTPVREGLSPHPENVFTALRLDTSYSLAWSIADNRRFEWFTMRGTTGRSAWLENPQQFVPCSVVFTTDGTTNFLQQQFDNAAAARAAQAPRSIPRCRTCIPTSKRRRRSIGEREAESCFIATRAESRGLSRCTTIGDARGHQRNHRCGGQFNANFEVLKNLHLIENAFYGDGVGRYIGGLGPDVVVKPNGTLSGVHAGSPVGESEWQTTPNFLVDGCYSGAYSWRNFDTRAKALGTPCGAGGTEYCTGFGFVGSANTNNRDYQEGTIGFIPTIWSSPNYGELQFISQFSYVVRTPWCVAPGQPKNAHIFITYLNLRYIIP